MSRIRKLTETTGLTVIVLVCCLGGFAPAQCPPGDWNGDCRVDWLDLGLLATYWLNEPNHADDPNHCATADAADLAVLANHWRRTGCPIVINELLAHSHDISPDWIELHNVSDVPVDIGGWFLSDNEQDLYKYRIEDGTVVEPNGYVVFHEDTQFGNPYHPGTQSPFALSENGESLCLYSGADEQFPDCLVVERFGASETWVTFGRHPTSMGTFAFVLMSEATPGQANTGPLVGPVVINEIMYHPVGDTDAEYVELLNISPGPVTLFDFRSMEPWRFTDDGGIALVFPHEPPVTLNAGEHILLTRNASLVRRTYGVPAHVQIFSWGSGRLSNSGERIRLLKPGDVDNAGTRYWVEVDSILYSDGTHPENSPDGVDRWPPEADGAGLSLNRIFPSRYGDDPGNWHATIPTPGSTND